MSLESAQLEFLHNLIIANKDEKEELPELTAEQELSLEAQEEDDEEILFEDF